MTEEFIGCIEEELKEIELFYEENGVEVEAYTLHNGSCFFNMLLKEIEKVCQTLIIIIMRYQNGFLY